MPQNVEVIWFTNFSSKLFHNMPLPWQQTFRHCQTMCCSHLHLKARMCAKSNCNPWKHSATITRNVRTWNPRVNRRTVTMTTHFPPLSKSMYFTSRVTCVPSLTEIHESIVRQSQCQKKSSRVNILYTWAWIKELLPWQGTFRHYQKVLSHGRPRNFHK